MRTSVGIPAYNVEKTIVDVISRIDRNLVNEILVVDDGSKDRTAELAESISGVKVIRHEKNMGYGGVQKTIFKHFRDTSQDPQDILIFLHGDGEMMPEEIPLLLEPMKDSNIEAVLGSRMMDGNNKGRLTRPLWKRTLDHLLSSLLSIASGTKLSTYFGGFRSIRRSLVSRLKFDDENLDNDHFYDMQILIRIVQTTQQFKEVPIMNVESDNEVTYSRLTVGWRILKEFWRNL